MAIAFLRLYNTFFLLIFLLSVSHNTNSIIYGQRKHEKEVEYCLNQNVNMTTKRARFSAFVISIVDNLCEQQY